MNHANKTTAIAIALGIVLLGVVAYFMWGRGEELPTVSVVGAGPVSEAQLTFINLAAQLEPIAFDTRVLSDPRFMTLQDIHTNIVSEAAGRNDPFAPLPGVTVTQ